MAASAQPSIKLCLGKQVLGVELFDLLSNQRIATFHREGSHCSFSDEISYEQFFITLRLDWGALHDGEPTLDLDVSEVSPGGTRKALKPKRILNHHTRLSEFASGNTSPRTYDLEFKGFQMRLVARKTFSESVGASLYIVDPHALQPK
jgi:hypothetical protein